MDKWKRTRKTFYVWRLLNCLSAMWCRSGNRLAGFLTAGKAWTRALINLSHQHSPPELDSLPVLFSECAERDLISRISLKLGINYTLEIAFFQIKVLFFAIYYNLVWWFFGKRWNWLLIREQLVRFHYVLRFYLFIYLLFTPVTIQIWIC